MEMFFFSATPAICFKNIEKNLASKIMTNISEEIKMMRAKSAKNTRQWAKAKGFGISISGISEMLTNFPGSCNVLDKLRCGHPWKFQHSIVRELIRTAKEDSKTSDCFVWRI